MEYLREIEEFLPGNEQEAGDREIILDLIREFPHTILTRENRVAHLTSSGFVVSGDGERVLFVHHNIYQTWSWTGGHADGDGELLRVALREVREETGAEEVRPLSEKPVSLDILTVRGHRKNGVYVAPHLHLNVTYLLTAPEDSPLRGKDDENSGVRWLPAAELDRWSDEPELLRVYDKILKKAQHIIKGCK